MWLLIVFFTENFRLLSHFTFYEHCKDRHFLKKDIKKEIFFSTFFAECKI